MPGDRIPFGSEFVGFHRLRVSEAGGGCRTSLPRGSSRTARCRLSSCGWRANRLQPCADLLLGQAGRRVPQRYQRADPSHLRDATIRRNLGA